MRKFFKLRTRYSYWSNSKFADKLRQLTNITKKPQCTSFEDWDQWEKNNRELQPFWFKVIEDWLSNLQDIVYWPADLIYSVRVYLVNRFFSKTHYLNTKLIPGEYYEIDHRILHASFEALVDYIEVEKAECHKPTKNDSTGYWLRYYAHIPIRDAAAGIQYLNWEIELGEESPYQSSSAKEQLALYNWWKFERPEKMANLDKISNDHFNQFAVMERKPEASDSWEVIRKMQDDLEAEEDQMLERLMRIRKTLWT